jgi:hypothetical protein
LPKAPIARSGVPARRKARAAPARGDICSLLRTVCQVRGTFRASNLSDIMSGNWEDSNILLGQRISGYTDEKFVQRPRRGDVPWHHWRRGGITKQLDAVLGYLVGRRLSTREVCDALELSRSTYYEQRDGGRLITADNLTTAARNLNLNPVDLVLRYELVPASAVVEYAEEISGTSGVMTRTLGRTEIQKRDAGKPADERLCARGAPTLKKTPPRYPGNLGPDTVLSALRREVSFPRVCGDHIEVRPLSRIAKTIPRNPTAPPPPKLPVLRQPAPWVQGSLCVKPRSCEAGFPRGARCLRRPSRGCMPIVRCTKIEPIQMRRSHPAGTPNRSGPGLSETPSQMRREA